MVAPRQGRSGDGLRLGRLCAYEIEVPLVVRLRRAVLKHREWNREVEGPRVHAARRAHLGTLGPPLLLHGLRNRPQPLSFRVHPPVCVKGDEVLQPLLETRGKEQLDPVGLPEVLLDPALRREVRDEPSVQRAVVPRQAQVAAMPRHGRGSARVDKIERLRGGIRTRNVVDRRPVGGKGPLGGERLRPSVRKQPKPVHFHAAGPQGGLRHLQTPLHLVYRHRRVGDGQCVCRHEVLDEAFLEEVVEALQVRTGSGAVERAPVRVNRRVDVEVGVPLALAARVGRVVVVPDEPASVEVEEKSALASDELPEEARDVADELGRDRARERVAPRVVEPHALRGAPAERVVPLLQHPASLRHPPLAPGVERQVARTEVYLDIVRQLPARIGRRASRVVVDQQIELLRRQLLLQPVAEVMVEPAVDVAHRGVLAGGDVGRRHEAKLLYHRIAGHLRIRHVRVAHAEREERRVADAESRVVLSARPHIGLVCIDEQVGELQVDDVEVVADVR